MAIQMSMQDSEMEDTDSSRPTTSATDDTQASPLPMDSEQVCATFLFCKLRIDSSK